MSLGACLPDLEASGKLSPEMAAEARALYDEKIADYVATGSREAAEALASADVLAALERQVTRKAFLAGRKIKVQSRIGRDLDGYAGGRGDGPINPNAAAALIDHDPRAGFSNVEGRRKAILGRAHRMIDRVLADHSANLRGQVRNKAQLQSMVRELFGEGTGDRAAAQLAGAWRGAAEMLRKRFNAAGGAIGFRADWGLPQSHDWQKVRAAGFTAWRDRVSPLLDPARMIDNRTGQPFTRAALERALPEIYDTIRTNGMSKVTPGAPGGKALANQHGDERFLVFKSADAWMEYAQEFGAGTPYDAMMGHVERMARDIAALEVLGPSPESTLRWVKDTVDKSAALDRSPDSKAISAARAAGKKIDALWDEYRGANLEPRNEKLAMAFSGLRAWQTATKLGSAYLSSTSDFAFQASRRAFNGLANRTLLPDYLKLMRPGSLEDQKLAVRRGLIAEEWAGRTAAQSRYLMEELTGEIPRRMAEGVLRLSLLSRHTQTMRWVYGMETLSTYTEMAGRSYDGLEPKLRDSLARYGIGPGDWDKLRTAPMDTDRGVDWISPHNLDDDELASRFMEMVLEETGIAVPEADLATRAIFNSTFERGTWMGEIGRSAVLFKSFGVSVMMRQAQEIMSMAGAQAARYAGGLIIGTTLAGAMALQLKAIAAGRDPRPMDDAPELYDEDGNVAPNPGFWGAAVLQGGGFGIFGDFLFSSQSRAGGGFAATLAGPLVDDAQGLATLATAKHRERSVVRELKGFLPGNNLWYARLAFDRMMADQINEAIDPEYRRSYRRLEQYAAEQGTDFWWSPGELEPSRAPDIANAFEEGPVP